MHISHGFFFISSTCSFCFSPISMLGKTQWKPVRLFAKDIHWPLLQVNQQIISTLQVSVVEAEGTLISIMQVLSGERRYGDHYANRGGGGGAQELHTCMLLMRYPPPTPIFRFLKLSVGISFPSCHCARHSGQQSALPVKQLSQDFRGKSTKELF